MAKKKKDEHNPDDAETRASSPVAGEEAEGMGDAGILLVKYWLEVSSGEQTRRLESRIDDPRKIWKLSAINLKSDRRWYDYSRARDAMFAATDIALAPWYIADADDKKRPGSTSSATCSARSRTNRWPPGTSNSPNGSRPMVMSSRTCRCAHPDTVLGGRREEF